jgi:tetratricopeptide (TPR) repeat protein
MSHASSSDIKTLVTAAETDPALWAHVQDCPRCRGRYVSALLPSVDHETPLDTVEKEALFDRVAESVQGERVRTFRRPALFGAAGGLAAAAALILAVVGVVRDPRAPDGASEYAERVQPPRSPAPAVRIEGSSGVEVNGETPAPGAVVGAQPFAVTTGAGDRASMSLPEVFSFTLGENSDMSVAFADTRAISATLTGVLDGELNHEADYSLEIRVPGGLYRVIGTIFHIDADSLRSTITVSEGAVAYIADRGDTDTIRAGATRTFSVTPPAAAPESATRRTPLDSPEPRQSAVRAALDTVPAPDSAAFEAFMGAALDSIDSAATGEPLSMLQRAKQTLQRGETAEAIALLRTALATPARAEAMLHLGYAFEKIAAYDSAITWFEQARSLAHPRAIRTVALAGLGRLYFSLERFDNAAAAYRDYLRIAPSGTGRAEAYRFLVNHAIRNENVDRQIALLEQWIEQSPRLDTPMYLLATAYREKGDLRYAIRYYETYILKYPDGEWIEDCYYWSAVCYRELGQHKDYDAKVRQYRKRFPEGQRLGSL